MAGRAAIGISFGNTTCCVATVRNGAAEVIANDMGNRVTHAKIAYSDEEITCGDPAYNSMPKNSQNTIQNVSRVLAKEFDDEGVQEDINEKRFFTTKMVDAAGSVGFSVTHNGKERVVSAAEAAATIIGQMKSTAEMYLGKEIVNAVISVPEHYDEETRAAIMKAAETANLHVLRLINEPTAACLAYNLDKNSESKKVPSQNRVLVFDLGGTSFDASVIDVLPNGVLSKVHGTGDGCLGGKDLDEKLLEFCQKEFRRKAKFNGKLNDKAKYRLKQQCEMVKKTLSSAAESAVEVDCLADDKDLSVNVTRENFELMANENMEICIEILESMFIEDEEDADFKPIDKSTINSVIFVGGSAKIPKMQAMVKEFMGADNSNAKNVKYLSDINPDEVVACGAAWQASYLLPSEYSKEFLSEKIDKSRANGAALTEAGASLTKGTISIEAGNGELIPIIPAGSKAPVTSTQVFGADPTKDHVFVALYQGNGTDIKKHNLLAKLKLENSENKKGLAIEFKLSEEGSLSVGVVGQEAVKVC